MDTDRNLLFGVLALQADLIDAAQFAEVCVAWTARKGSPLADLILERAWMSPADRRVVEDLLELRLRKHGGDARASLAAIADDQVRRYLSYLDDPDIRSSLDALPNTSGHVVLSTLDHGPGVRERYKLTRLHAQGGLGRVWLARDAELGREVALKELRPERTGSPSVWARFLDEARITGQLEHPGIVPVYELAKGVEGRQPFYTMRFVQGKTLAEAAQDYHRKRAAGAAGSLEFRALLNSFIGVCNAVAYSHSRGVIHRDLKGPNVVLGDYGEVIVLDWGLAKKIDEPSENGVAPPVMLEQDGGRQQTVQGQVVGTPGYMAPEQAEGRLDSVDRSSDIYGLGAILFEVLTGHPPHRGKSHAEILKRIIAGATPRARAIEPSVAPALEAVCARAMAKAQADRYATALELAEDVGHWLADEPVTAYREGPLARIRRWSRKHPRATVITSVLAFLDFGYILAVILSMDDQSSSYLFNLFIIYPVYILLTLQFLWLAGLIFLLPLALAFGAANGNMGREFRRHCVRVPLRLAKLEFFILMPLFIVGFIALAIQWREGRPVADGPNFPEAKVPAVPYAERAFATTRQLQSALEAYREGLLRAGDRPAEAERAFRRALPLWQELGRLYPGVPEYRQHLELTHKYLHMSLMQLGRPDAAILELRAAIRLHPDDPWTHSRLGDALIEDDQVDAAIPELRAASRLKPDDPSTHSSLGYALALRRDFSSSAAAYREAVRLRPDSASDHGGLCHALRLGGQLEAALAASRRYHEVASMDPQAGRSREFAAAFVRETGRMIELADRLPAILHGDDHLVDADQRVAVALLCYQKKLYGGAAHFFESAFAARPELAEDVGMSHRYNAACAAALAGCGRGEDDPPLDESARQLRRRQALDWLRVELAARARRLKGEDPLSRQEAWQYIHRWKRDVDLRGLRDEAELADLPEEERADYRKFWSEVEALLELPVAGR